MDRGDVPRTFSMPMNTEGFELKRRLKHREDMFLRRLFAILAMMAKADRKVDAWEAHAAERAFERFPRAAARRKFCVRVFNVSKNARKSLFRLAWEFANKWATPEDCLAVYELLWDIACSTGILKPIHKSNLEGICRYLNLPESYFGIYYRKRSGTFREWTEADEKRERDERLRRDAQKCAQDRQRAEARRREEERRQAEEAAREAEARREYQKRAREWFYRHFRDAPPPRSKPESALRKEYELLGCACDASDDAVRLAYRMAAKKYHPDLLRANGYPESLIQKATVKMAQINAAWEKIRKERNI